LCFFFQAEDGIRDGHVTGVQTCALPIYCTTFTNLSVWMATVGTPYWVSSVIACVDVAGAQVLQWPTPMMAACPCSRISVHSLGRSEERRVGKSGGRGW